MTASATSSVQNLTQNYFNISDVTKINNKNNTNSNNINTNKIPFVNLKNSLISGTSLSALSISPSIKTTTTTTVLLTESITGRTLGLSSSSSSSSSRTTTTPDVLGIISQKPPSLPTPLKQFQLTSLSSETVAGNGVVSTSILTTYTTGLPPPSQLTTIPIQQNKTTATIITNSKRPTIIIYPTVTPESIVIPIVSCILGFPLLALLVICCLRRRAKLARERDRRRNYDMQDHAVSLVRFSPIHRLNNRSSRAISLRPERSLSRGFPSLELDTVIEERSDPEQTQTDILSPESPSDPLKYRDFNSS